jgi:carbon-monoxide dehydrogenase small subunit
MSRRPARRPRRDHPAGPLEQPREDGVQVHLEINGQAHELDVAPVRRLLDVLRYDLGLTGTKESCAVGVCGACSVLVDGELVSACLLPVALADGRRITTIEGIAAPDGELTGLQTAFIREGGLQCGACTPGQIIAATALLAEEPRPSEPRIREWMSGNLCRCTGYAGIIRAIQAAATESTGAGATTGAGSRAASGTSIATAARERNPVRISSGTEVAS